MKLRMKIVLIMTSTLVAFIIALALLSNAVLTAGFSDLEKMDLEKNVRRVVNAMGSEIESMNTTCEDWASWDDTYGFIEDGNEDYISSNLLNETFMVIDVDAIVFADTDGEITFAKAIDMESGLEDVMPAGFVELIGPGMHNNYSDRATAGYAGIVRLSAGAYILSFQPILPSLKDGPSRGTLLMGRLIDEAEALRLADITQMAVSFHLYDDGALSKDLLGARYALSQSNTTIDHQVNGSAIMGYTFLRDFAGEPVIICKIVLDRGIYRQGQASFAYLMAGLVFLSATVIVVTAIVFEQQVLSRIFRLSEDVKVNGTGDRFAERLKMDGNDEIASLTGAINLMLDNIEKSMNALKTTKNEMARQARQANELCMAVVENIGMERACGLLYDSGWRLAMNEAGLLENATPVARLQFLEGILSKQTLAVNDAVVIKDFRAGDMNARLMILPSNQSGSGADASPMESYQKGYFAGILSLALGQQIGLVMERVELNGRKALEFTTKLLEPYERSAYAFT